MKSNLATRLVAISVVAFALSQPDIAAGNSDSQHIQILYRFSGSSDGRNPTGPLIADATGDLFGISEGGDADEFGSVFELAPAGNGTWSKTVLHRFLQDSGGEYPVGGLTMDESGQLYGVTFDGGNCPQYCGVVFSLSPSTQPSGTWKYSVLYRFGGPDAPSGGGPNSSLVRDAKGDLFGTTQLGGAVACANSPGPCGTVFELSPPTHGGSWMETVLYSFRGVPDGDNPSGGVVRDAQGDLYGPTGQGGAGKCNDGEGLVIGCGIVFELSASQSGWAETPLYSFTKKEQSSPAWNLVFGPDDALYGIAGYDVFCLAPPTHPGAAWRKETIYEFSVGESGTIPSGPIAFDANGNIFGTTSSSGLTGYSTAFRLSPPSQEGLSWTQKALAKFGKGFDSIQPHGGLLVGTNGTLYGAAFETSGGGYVFAITP